MLIKTLALGPLETNCYIVIDEKTLACAVIDPAGDASTLLDYLEDNHLKCRFALLTHGHFDHVGAVNELLEETDAVLAMHKADDGATIGGDYYKFNAPEGTQFFAEGDVIAVDSLSFTVMETPGHTPGSVCLLCTTPDGDRAIFSGDTLFRDSCGRTDFMMGSTEDMFRSLKRLAELPGDCEVYPGHGFSTTLSRERSVNYFMNAALRQ